MKKYTTLLYLPAKDLTLYGIGISFIEKFQTVFVVAGPAYDLFQPESLERSRHI